VPLLALAALLLTGCSDNKQVEDKLKGKFGPGSGGPALSGASSPLTLTKADGGAVGTSDYDPAEFAQVGATETDQIDTLAEATGTLTIAVLRIAGRPDTPCHFQAALLARDDGYKILASGDRKNDLGVKFNQVNLKNGGAYVSLFCAELSGNSGALFYVLTDSADKIDWMQVHFILNSVRKS